ncbi:MAG: hypothetical protein ACOY4L_00240 [Pseudomonadota bacterium]
MKNLRFIFGLAFLVPGVALAATATLTVGGGAVNGDPKATQELTVTSGTNVPFTQFSMTLSKGVGIVATETGAGAVTPAVTVTTGHFNSPRVYAGSTAGGSVTECTTAKKTAGNGAVTAATYSAGVC